MTLYADVVVSTGTRMTDMRFTYLVPEHLEIDIEVGMSVYVPFGGGNRKTAGLVMNLHEDFKEDFQAKEIQELVDNQMPLREESIQIADYMVRENLSDYSSALATVMPPGSVGEISPIHRSYYSCTKKGENAEPAANAIRQKAVLDYLKSHGTTEQRKLVAETSASTQTLKTLVNKGWIHQSNKREYRRQPIEIAYYDKKTLNPDQERVYEGIKEEKGTYLICGVTGSGKTEIYLHLVEDALKEGKEAIVLVPEISLTPQTIERFQGRFGDQVAILHSRLTLGQRYEEWEKIYNGEVSIAIGARSAIFAPFVNLGVIIIDEEHEQSYISERNPKYRTHEIAELRRNYHQCSLVLGSATPSMESLYKAEKGEWKRYDLRQRANKQALPNMHIIDMRIELMENNRTMFSRSLKAAMDQALEKNEQIILFLNKRGHTSFVFCRKCGYVYRCDACDVAMTYHKHRNRLICHYCGREQEYHHVCPQCKSKAIKEFGAGTEQLEEEVRKLYPDKNIVRADADTMKKRGAYSKVYREMMSGQTDILLGTQMISKGFDFPRVSVVGIVSADITLNLPDLRSTERTFQLITQVAGRAGRGDLEGNVYIQTYHPDNFAIKAAVNHDVDGFYQEELGLRQENFYPPISQELHIGIQGADRRKCIEKGNEIRRFIDDYFATRKLKHRIEGPTASVIERINRKYRFGIMVRCQDKDLLLHLGKKILEQFPTSRALNIIVSLNPANIY